VILADAEKEMNRLMLLMEAGLEAYREAPAVEAAKERDYRRLRSLKFLEAPEGTAAQREAWVDAESADARYERDVARGLVLASRESVRARAAQLSALQSLMNAHRAEAEFARTTG